MKNGNQVKLMFTVRNRSHQLIRGVITKSVATEIWVGVMMDPIAY